MGRRLHSVLGESLKAHVTPQEANTCFPGDFTLPPVPCVDFALCPFTVTSHSLEEEHVLSPVGPSRESSILGVAMTL